jgi:hypothetical protein
LIRNSLDRELSAAPKKLPDGMDVAKRVVMSLVPSDAGQKRGSMMGKRLICLSVLLIICLTPGGQVNSSEGINRIIHDIYFSQDDLILEKEQGFDVVSLRGCPRLRDEGQPNLPVKFVHLVLPPNCAVSGASVTNAVSIILEGKFRILPTQPDLRTDGSFAAPWVDPDPTIYNSISAYPAQMIEIVNEGYLGGNHLVTLAVTPFQYRPATGELLFYSSLTVDIQLDQVKRIPAASYAKVRPAKAERLCQRVLNRLVNNKEDVVSFNYRYNLSLQPENSSDETTTYYEYIVITSPELATSFQPLIDWKIKKGIKSCVVSLDSILTSYTGKDDAEKLRNFLIEAYYKGTVWVLLGGDEHVVPIRYAYPTNTTSVPSNASQQICDLYYSDVDGDWDFDNDGVWGEPQSDRPDVYPDLFVGRVPASDADEVSAFVDKLLCYERNPGGGALDYLTRALWISSDQMRDWDEGIGQHGLLSPSIPSNFNQDLTGLVESPTGAAENPAGPGGGTCVETMNQGWGIIGILAHGKSSGFVAKSNLTNGDPKSWVLTQPGGDDGNGYMPNLTNFQKYGIAYSISCSQGALDVDEYPYMGGEPCVGEFYPLVPQKGGVAFLGYSRWGWVSISYKLFDKFLEYLFDENLGHHIGVAEALSRCAYPAYRDIDYGHNLFGDPEMPVWTETPSPIAVDHPDQIILGKQIVELSVSSNGSGVDGAQVCMTLRGQTLFLGETDQNGELSCNLDLNDIGEMDLVVTKPHLVPYEDSITISLASDADDDDADVSTFSFDLSQNHPNPFNPSTSIRYTVDSKQTSLHTSLKIYNILGQRVRTLVNEEKQPGQHLAVWDGKDDGANDVSSGIYFYILETGEFRETKKMTLIR